MLIPGGSSIGVTLHTKGALVVGISPVPCADGQQISPAAAAGIQAGDIIEQVNGVDVKDAAHLAQMCNRNHDRMELTVNRLGTLLKCTLHACLDETDQQYRMGMWVRDSTAGVGTLSFYDPDSQWYAALGHAITDIDTKSNLSVREGEIVQSSVIDIVQGVQGHPGELRGSFHAGSLSLGTIQANSEYGIYGKMHADYHNTLYQNGLEMAYPEEAKPGPAKILTTLDDDGIVSYDCRIVKINPQSDPAPKGMVIEITDEELLAKTGGIVQGMSGSPLIQNDKLVGVVTHVFINDPTKGYCMYTQWMYDRLVKESNA